MSFIGPGHAPRPNQVDTRPSCASVFVGSLIGNPPTEQALTQGTQVASEAFANASLTYQMRRMLVVPLRSLYGIRPVNPSFAVEVPAR